MLIGVPRGDARDLRPFRVADTRATARLSRQLASLHTESVDNAYLCCRGSVFVGFRIP